MKCDELKIYRTHTDNLGDNYIDAEFVDVVLKEDVDNAIAELKEENKLLKEHIANGDVSRITWIDEVIELKQKLHDAEMAKDLAEAANTEYREDIKKLKDKNEKLKEKLQNLNDAYCRLDAMYQIDTGIACKVFGQGSVNCKALRATRRALLLMCSKRAKAEAYAEDIMADLLLRGGTSMAVDYHRFERDKWNKKAEICKAKAEEYK